MIRIVVASVIFVLGTSYSFAQDQDDLPALNAYGEALRQAYEQLLRGDYSDASASYARTATRFADDPATVRAALHGKVVSDILAHFQQNDGRAARLFLIDDINQLHEDGVISSQERDFWNTLINADGDLEALSDQPEFNFLDPEVFAGRAAAAEQ